MNIPTTAANDNHQCLSIFPRDGTASFIHLPDHFSAWCRSENQPVYTNPGSEAGFTFAASCQSTSPSCEPCVTVEALNTADNDPNLVGTYK